ncbi:MAG: D-hexose-6-phosphate mutarotase [Victivallales bacterium]|jgi:glucose-6-phosphate 1-epimerase|nr:D-hexose-6-phosphate mutarotase [Victivallales bacterium]
MSNINELQKKFGSESINFKLISGGFITAEIKNSEAEAEICLHGAHLMKFVPNGELPVIWMSKRSVFEPNKAISGGVPICWPYFGSASDPALPKHGFARLSDWQVAEVASESNATRIAFELHPEDVTAMPVAFPFELRMEFVIGKSLLMTLSMKNCSPAEQVITDALHPYFNVKAVEKIAIKGLDQAMYNEYIVGLEKFDRVQNGDIIINREVDRVYFDTTGAIEIYDPGFERTILVEKSGSASTVVWNPWIAKAHAMPYLDDDEFHTMVCIEAANAFKDRRVIPPGKTHVLSQKISVKN